MPYSQTNLAIKESIFECLKNTTIQLFLPTLNYFVHYKFAYKLDVLQNYVKQIVHWID